MLLSPAQLARDYNMIEVIVDFKQVRIIFLFKFHSCPGVSEAHVPVGVVSDVEKCRNLWVCICHSPIGVLVGE